LCGRDVRRSNDWLPRKTHHGETSRETPHGRPAAGDHRGDFSDEETVVEDHPREAVLKLVR